MSIKKIIVFLFISFLIVTVSHAQCKIYQGKYASRSPVAVFENAKIYQGRHASGSPISVTQNRGGACAFAAAAYMLLL
jgi:hypothetical protein